MRCTSEFVVHSAAELNFSCFFVVLVFFVCLFVCFGVFFKFLMQERLCHGLKSGDYTADLGLYRRREGAVPECQTQWEGLRDSSCQSYPPLMEIVIPKVCTYKTRVSSPQTT